MYRALPDCYHHHHYHHHTPVMQLGHLLTRSGLTYPEVSSKVFHDSFCQLDGSVSLPWVIYFEAFYLHVVSSFNCIPVICPTIGVIFNSFAICVFVSQSVHCILLFFSRIKSNYSPRCDQQFCSLRRPLFHDSS